MIIRGGIKGTGPRPRMGGFCWHRCDKKKKKRKNQRVTLGTERKGKKRGEIRRNTHGETFISWGYGRRSQFISLNKKEERGASSISNFP